MGGSKGRLRAIRHTASSSGGARVSFPHMGEAAMKALIAQSVLVVVVLCAVWTGTASGTAYLGIYADADHAIVRVDGTLPWYNADVWVWCLPDARGLQAAQFGLSYPPNAFADMYSITLNPDITAALGSPTEGISVAFDVCRHEWTWILHQRFWVADSAYGEVRLVPDSSVVPPMLAIADCEPGYPYYPVSILNNLLSLNCQATRDLFKPHLSSVEAIAPDTILATFTPYLMEEACWFPQGSNFRVISAASPPETLAVTNTWFRGGGHETVWIRLGQNLVPGADYRLEATHMCNDDWVGNCCCCICTCMNCADSEMGFTYRVPIATLLRGFSVQPLSEGIQVSWELGVADEGVVFQPMRLEKGRAEFEPLGAPVVEEGALQYRLMDSDARPGTAWKYRVDYLDGGTRSTLFETEWVEALPARFALHQNLPNPFNPSTRISFELGAPCRATLAVYDVSGKLVRTLLDETLAPGVHSIEWDGRAERGKAASSGMYFYKLRAGSFTETRKMVLLR
jgi:hypothetical protein